MLATHEDIRNESQFQHKFTRQSFLNNPDGSASTFFVTSDDPIKFVPSFGTGATTAGVSDVQVFVGLSGVLGMSRMVITSLDIENGSVTLNKVPDNGASLVANYCSSPISDIEVEQVRLNAEGIVNQRLSMCYDLPISPTPSSLRSLVSRLSASLLLIKGYGVGARDTSRDGWALYSQLMGSQDESGARMGEISLICSPDYQLIDDNSQVIARNDLNNTTGGDSYIDGGNVKGRLFDITEENFRFKKPQPDANRRQAGSADNSFPTIR